MELRRLLEILLRRKWILIWIFLLITGGTYIMASSMVEVFESVSRVKIETTDDTGLLLAQVPPEFKRQDYIMSTAAITQSEVMKSGIVMEAVIDELGLTKRPTFIHKILRSFGIGKNRKQKRLRVDELSDPSVVTAFLQKRSVSVEAIMNTDVVEIYAYSFDPEEAMVLANLVAETYLKVSTDFKAAAAKTALTSLYKNLDKATKELEVAQEELKKFQIESGFVDLENQNEAFISYMADLEKTIYSLNQQIHFTESVLHSVDGKKQAGAANYNLFSSLEQVNPVIQTLKLQHSNMLSELTVLLSSDYTEEHPKVIEQKAKIATIQNQIDQEVNKTFSSELKRLQTLKETTVAELNNQLERIKAWPESQVRYAELKRAVSLAEERSLNFESQVIVAQLAAETPITNALIVHKAVMPDPSDPYYPKPALYAIISMFIATVLGCGLALVIDYMDDTLYSEEDIEEFSKLPVITKLPRTSRTKTRPQAFLRNSQADIYAAFLELRHRIVDILLNRNDNLVMISSSSSKEGKSLVSALSGVILSQKKLQTVVVDLHHTKPALKKSFSVSQDSGLSDYLTNPERTVEEIVSQTNISHLSLISTGTQPHLLVEGIYSNRFKELLEQLKNQYDLVIIDSPALDKFRSAPYLLQLVKNVILVVRLRSITGTKLTQSGKILENNGADPLGIVVNR